MKRNSPNGKGDKRRLCNTDLFLSNWDSIFGKKDQSAEQPEVVDRDEELHDAIFNLLNEYTRAKNNAMIVPASLLTAIEHLAAVYANTLSEDDAD